MKKILIAGLLLWACLPMFGQNWTDVFTTGGEKNFYVIRDSFNAYWKNRPIEKGKGWKPFKRWEWYWQWRVDERGNFPPPDVTQKEWDRYLATQSINERSANGNWTSLGPTSSGSGYSGIGRINCIGFHPTDLNTFYVGTPAGGLWKTTNGGASWTALTDNLASIGVSAIVVHPTTPNTLFIATGDGDGGNTRSIGVLKSTNGGATWTTTGLTWQVNQFFYIRSLIMNPNTPNTMLAATNNGIYRTADGGTTWANTLSGNFYDIEFKPSDPNTVYAANGSQVYRSTNGGLTWTQTLSIIGSGRIALGVSAANSAFVAVLSAQNGSWGFHGFYSSFNSGASFAPQSSSPNILGGDPNGFSSGGQGLYDLACAVSPANASIIYVGGINMWKSTNGGVSWALVSNWYGIQGVDTVHADCHALAFQNNTNFFACNDGGIYRSTNGGSTWTDLTNGMVHSQMYRLGASSVSTKLITGLQDNGSKIRQTNNTWTDVIGGDGMECAIETGNDNVVYGELYFGDMRRSLDGGATWTDIQANMPGSPQGAWVTPFALDPNNAQTIVAGFADVYKSTNRGTSWTQISTNLTGGIFLTSLAIAPSNSNVIYTARDNAIYKTVNNGVSWSNITGALPVGGSKISYIAVHNANANTLWVTMSGYVAGQKVYKSSDGGVNWTNISGSLPNLPANCIVFQNGSNEGLYVGMDVGVFYRDGGMNNWVAFNTNLPNTPISELEIHYVTGRIRAATFGRGLWESDLYSTNCPVTLHFTAPITSGTHDYEASNYITATNTIGSAANVTYDGKNYVQLNPVFFAQYGSVFLAVPDGCGGTYFAGPDNDDRQPDDEKEDKPAITAAGFTLRPNPAADLVTIVATFSGNATVGIFDLSGRQVLRSEFQESEAMELDISGFHTGVYLVILQAEDVVHTQKLVVHR